MPGRHIFNIDYLLLLPVLVLTTIGIMFIYSAGISTSGESASGEYLRQIIWASVGLALALALSMANYRVLYRIALPLFLGTVALLAATVAFGRLVQGAERWLRIGGIGLQGSEFAKLATIVLLARYLNDSKINAKSFGRFAVACLIVAVPMGLVFIQPDLGTALVFIAILLCMAFVAGISKRYIAFSVACIGLTGILTVMPFWQLHILQRPVPAIEALGNVRLLAIVCFSLLVIAAIAIFGFLKYHKGYFFWIVYSVLVLVFSLGASFVARGVLRDYQIMRLVVFLNPQVDPSGAGWNIIQSTTAIGAGGFSGLGFLQGTQSTFRYLPVQSTDFIFSVLSEETGFVGGMTVFALFLAILLRLARLVRIAADPFASYICAGLIGMYGFHFIINVGMTMGIMPITGIPLVFMSYGGSSLVTAMMGIGLALSIYVRRYNLQAI
ncbi:MAG: rod shape-determining protein RodA [Treponema sp.]|nr:rod shape-determining protein RodA [Treponema sp.]